VRTTGILAAPAELDNPISLATVITTVVTKDIKA
jgi:hypothetical protein